MPQRHSKNNNDLAYFTYDEKKKLGYGTQRERLGKDSIKPFDARSLCLKPFIDPMCCHKKLLDNETKKKKLPDLMELRWEISLDNETKKKKLPDLVAGYEEIELMGLSEEEEEEIELQRRN